LTTVTNNTERIRAHQRSERRLGPWTSARHFEIQADRGSVVLDLLLPQIEPGEITLQLDINHATVILLVPDGTQINDDELRRRGRGGVKDWTGVASPDGRPIRLSGEMRNAELRIHRGGIAILRLLASRKHRELRQAHREGRL
jgi:hypothetical protein